MFRLALAQMNVLGGEKERNVSRAEAMVGEAVAHGAECVVLPEAMDLGWTHPAALTDAEPIPSGSVSRRLARAAREHGVYLCSGLVERDGDRVYNAAVLIDPQGDVILKHRKLNELEIGHPYYDQGDRLGVCRTELGTVGLMICADGFAQDRVLSRALGYMGADIILSPSAWAVAKEHDNRKEPYGETWRQAYIPVARDFSLWIAGVSNVGWVTGGPWEGRKCIGCSLVIDPSGTEVLQGPYGADAEALLYVDVEPQARPARGCGWVEHWGDRREA